MLRALVLGSAAGGGFPQWNCRCPVCQLAWARDPRVRSRTQSSLAVSIDPDHWVILNASPDLRQQILAHAVLQPRHGSRHSPISAVVLTNGDVDHVTGLLSVRERQAFSLYATHETLAVLAQNSVFGVLDPNVVRRVPMVFEEPRAMGNGLSVTAFAVPGKPPLYLEDESLVIGAETGSTIGLEISGGGHRLFYIPGCAEITDRLLARVAGAELLFFDATTFTDDEMPALGLSDKTARRMGHIPIGGPDGSLARFAEADIARRVFIHINNTNPILVEGSPEYEAARRAGWEVSYDGMDIRL